METTTTLDSLFRLSGPSQADIDSFHDNGYIVYPDVFTDDGREGLIEEITQHFEPTRQYIEALNNGDEQQRSYFIRPWNDRGEYSDRLIDDPFHYGANTGNYRRRIPLLPLCPSTSHPAGSVRLDSTRTITIGSMRTPSTSPSATTTIYRFCTNPNGFTRGDRNLKVIPGSHKVAPTKEATPERMLAGDFDEEAGRKLEEKRLELPPGSMVYIDARILPRSGSETRGFSAALSYLCY